jgi:hypothetical protein
MEYEWSFSVQKTQTMDSIDSWVTLIQSAVLAFYFFNSPQGRVVAQEVSRRPPTAKARVRARVSPFGLCGKVALRKAFSEFFGFPCPYHSTAALQTHISSGVKQEARRWPQFRDIVWPHWHKQQQQISPNWLPLRFSNYNCACFYHLPPYVLYAPPISPFLIWYHNIR